jgi:hypothetical protein
MDTYIATFINTDNQAWWEESFYAESFEAAQEMAENLCSHNVVVSEICDTASQAAFDKFNGASNVSV